MLEPDPDATAWPNTHYPYERIREGKLLHGVFEVGHSLPIARVIDDLLVKEDYEPGKDLKRASVLLIFD